MEKLFYVQITVICLAFLIFIYFWLKKQVSGESDLRVSFNRIVLTAIALCLSDMLAYVSGGNAAEGMDFVQEASNMIYYEAMTLLALEWLLYTCKRTERVLAGAVRYLIWLPLLLITLIIMSNPMTRILFEITEEHTYARGNGVLLHWIATWSYYLVASVLTFRSILLEKNRIRKADMKPLAYFIAAPLLCGIIQMFVPGISLVPAGITFSVFLITMNMQESLICADELTGLNNRRHLSDYVEGQIQRKGAQKIMAMMIDVNRFKSINDTFGHAIGDEALLDCSEILKAACGKVPRRLFLSRYGGDEFVIAGCEVTEETFRELKEEIRRETDAFNHSAVKVYRLDFSIGIAGEICSGMDDFDSMLRQADARMYLEKKKAHERMDTAKK